MKKLGIINYGAGNYGSVWNAYEYLNVTPIEVQEPSQLREVDHIVLPGVGSFPACMKKLQSIGIVEALHKEVIEEGKPFLGICVGMQILATVGYEFKECNGLNWIHGKVDKIDTSVSHLRLPHIGWNECNIKRNCVLFSGIDEKAMFYFVHSYHLQPKSDEHIAAVSEYGTPIVAVIQKENIFGVQFHPEKSQRHGLQLLKNFASINC